jgi:hypothetical protein
LAYEHFGRQQEAEKGGVAKGQPTLF